MPNTTPYLLNDLILSILMVMISSFGLNTYSKLKSVLNDYDSDYSYEKSTGLSKSYVKSGFVLMITLVIFSILNLIRNIIKISRADKP